MVIAAQTAPTVITAQSIATVNAAFTSIANPSATSAHRSQSTGTTWVDWHICQILSLVVLPNEFCRINWASQPDGRHDSNEKMHIGEGTMCASVFQTRVQKPKQPKNTKMKMDEISNLFIMHSRVAYRAFLFQPHSCKFCVQVSVQSTSAVHFHYQGPSILL